MTALAQDEMEEAAARLRAGGLVAFPTETVYGLGADATNADAVLSIYETKGRPRFNPLIVHVPDLAMAETLGTFTPLARKLADHFWPGPLTLLVPLRPGHGLTDLATAGLATVGLRVPDHPVALDLLCRTGRPLAAPSANPSGKLSPTTAEQVRRGFGGAVRVLDGGPCQSGVESTILGLAADQPIQLRAGALSREEIEAFLGMPVPQAADNAEVSAPGMLLSHYAPNAHIRLDATPRQGEAFLAFGPTEPFDGPTRNLSPRADLREAARNLFSMLHDLDATGASTIAVAPIPETGLGEAINDRLRRAAAPRIPPSELR
jgi:L-threonylcarbamoyladenylate synthase